MKTLIQLTKDTIFLAGRCPANSSAFIRVLEPRQREEKKSQVHPHRLPSTFIATCDVELGPTTHSYRCEVRVVKNADVSVFSFYG